MTRIESPFDEAQPVPNNAVYYRRRRHFPLLLTLMVLGGGAYAYHHIRHPHMVTAGPVSIVAAKPVSVTPASAPAPALKLPNALGAAGSGQSGRVDAPSGGGLFGLGTKTSSIVHGSSTGIDAALKIDAAKQQAAAMQAAAARPANVTSTSPVVVADSFTDIINSNVTDENGQAVGKIYDILVDRQSGLATNVIINNAEDYRGVSLRAIHFNQVDSQSPNGSLKISTDAVSLAGSQRFSYAQIPNSGFISLRGLEGGQVLDDQGKVSGKISAITYDNGSAQNIVFTIPPLVATQKGVNFVLPYQSVKIITGPTGQHYIQLNAVQTAAVAKTMFPAKK